MISENAARERLYVRSGFRCEICGDRGTNAQHRKPRSGGGTWALSNLLHVCGSGNATGHHGLIHHNPTLAYANGWSVRRSVDPAAMPALLATDYGQHYVWLRDDGTKDFADLTDVAVAALATQGAP